MGLCVTADLYSYGLPRGGTPNPGRLASTVSTSANTIALEEHGFDAGFPVRLRAEAGGSLPSPLAEGVEYYALPVDDGHFSLSAAPEGAAIDLTTTGARFVVIAPLPTEAAIEWATGVIYDMVPAHIVPMTAPYPPLIVATCAELAAGKLLALRGSSSKSLGEMLQWAQKRLERWSKGVPVRGINQQRAANLSVGTTLPYPDSRGWSRWGGL